VGAFLPTLVLVSYHSLTRDILSQQLSGMILTNDQDSSATLPEGRCSRYPECYTPSIDWGKRDLDILTRRRSTLSFEREKGL
jgi:hypothetical protein